MPTLRQENGSTCSLADRNGTLKGPIVIESSFCCNADCEEPLFF